jgi:uncharacterized protein YggL (DUF469 family)
VFGVTIRAEPRGESAERLLARFTQTIERRGLVRRGRTGPRWELVVSSEAGQMTELDRQAIVEWLDEQPELQHVSVGALTDVQGAG